MTSTTVLDFHFQFLTSGGRSRGLQPLCYHTGQVEILLGGDNNLFFPSEIERDSQGMALYRSNLTQGYKVYGSVPSNIVTWVEPLDPSSNRTRKFKRSTWQSGKETGGKSDLPVKNPEKNQDNRNRTRRGTKNSGRKLGGKTGKLGGETGKTSISSRRNQEENQEARVKNQSNRKGKRRVPRSFREKTQGQEEKQPVLNLTPISASVRSDPTTTPVTPTSPESQNYSNTPIESGNLAPALRSRPEPAQDEFHSNLNEINQ